MSYVNPPSYPQRTSGSSSGMQTLVALLVPQLLRHDKVIRPGIAASYVSDQVTKQLGLKGTLIGNIRPGGAAYEAGLIPIRRDEEEIFSWET